jgi:hypothetical protein
MALRGVLHGAMALYLTRYLNVPPARIPGEDGEQFDDLPADVEFRAALLDAFDRQRQVDLAARLVAWHLKLGHPPEALVATLARARYAKMQVSMPIRCWRRESGSSPSGTTLTPADTSSLRSPAISRPIPRPNAWHCGRPTSPAA